MQGAVDNKKFGHQGVEYKTTFQKSIFLEKDEGEGVGAIERQMELLALEKRPIMVDKAGIPSVAVICSLRMTVHFTPPPSPPLLPPPHPLPSQQVNNTLPSVIYQPLPSTTPLPPSLHFLTATSFPATPTLPS